jgi:hypothetical protein
MDFSFNVLGNMIVVVAKLGADNKAQFQSQINHNLLDIYDKK